MQENWHIVDNNHNSKVNDRLPEGPRLVSDFYKEKALFSWQAGLCLEMQHSSSNSPPASSLAGPLVSFTVPALGLSLQNYSYLGSFLRLDKRTGGVSG